MLMSLTPGSRLSAFSTLIAQAPQSMPSTRILSAPPDDCFSGADIAMRSPRISRRDTLYGPCTNYRVNAMATEQLTIGDLAKATGHESRDDPLLRAHWPSSGARTHQRQLSRLQSRAFGPTELHSPSARSRVFPWQVRELLSLSDQRGARAKLSTPLLANTSRKWTAKSRTSRAAARTRQRYQPMRPRHRRRMPHHRRAFAGYDDHAHDVTNNGRRQLRVRVRPLQSARMAL